MDAIIGCQQWNMAEAIGHTHSTAVTKFKAN